MESLSSRWWNGWAIVVLAGLSFAGWIGLLAWNAAEARRLLTSE